MFIWVMNTPNYICHMYGAMIHRSDGPAIIEPDRKQWIYGGVYHREDGPAIMTKSKHEGQFWLNGKFIEQGIIEKELFNKYWGEQ
jgi:hypothetical protein